MRDNRSHLRLLHCRCRNYYIFHYRLGSCHLGCHHSCCQNLANRQDQIDDDLDRANRYPDCRCKVGSAEDHPIVYLGKNIRILDYFFSNLLNNHNYRFHIILFSWVKKNYPNTLSNCAWNQWKRINMILFLPARVQEWP